MLHAPGPIDAFQPAAAEGVQSVAWFTPDEAAAAVRHPSLIPIMRRARDMLAAGEVVVPGRGAPASEPHTTA